MSTKGEEGVTRVRIFSLEESSTSLELPLSRKPRKAAPADEAAAGDSIQRRKREETAARCHAFLRQTVPPSDPVVREIERRRSGRDGE
jgi:hypothetical protein